MDTVLIMEPTSVADDIAHQEERDILDPLRHVRKNHDDEFSDEQERKSSGFDSDSAILPSQPPSVHNQIITLSFPVSDLDEKRSLSSPTTCVRGKVKASLFS